MGAEWCRVIQARWRGRSGGKIFASRLPQFQRWRDKISLDASTIAATTTLGFVGKLAIDTFTSGFSGNHPVFASVTAGGVDEVPDFTLTQDAIDLSGIFALTGSVVTVLNPGFFVQVAAFGAGTDSTLAIDADGTAGGLSYTIVGGVRGVTSGQLFDFNNFIV